MDAGRTKALNRIVSSAAQLRLLLAGPGTGKTHTFKQLIATVTGTPLVLSFLGNLVRDLDKELGGVAEVKTFHAFCRKLLHQMDVSGISRGVDYYPSLDLVFQEDVAIVLDRPVAEKEIEHAMMLLDDSQGFAAAAVQAGNYYDAVGHTDSVYRVHSALRSDPSLIPAYPLVLVDEYQDFNLLETSLIEQLATKTPIVIAGDDDQALYSFKKATPKHLRDLATSGLCECLELPYCSRCTAVLVDATHHLVAVAQARGLLPGRINKPYICYLPKKAAVSQQYPKVVHARCTVQRNDAPYMSRYVAEQIAHVSSADVTASVADANPTVLVVGPSQFARQVFKHLVEIGVPNVTMQASTQASVEAIDGYLRISKNAKSRLGWRILLAAHRPLGWDEAVRRALLDGDELGDALDARFVQRHVAIAELIDRCRGYEALSDAEVELMEVATGLSLVEMRVKLGIDKEPAVEKVYGKPTIVVTTLVGAKGLQAEHVYVVGVNNGHFPRNNQAPTDDEIRCCLVALTRAKQSCTLVSCDHFGGQTTGQSVFVEWLKPYIQGVYVNAEYWKRRTS